MHIQSKFIHCFIKMKIINRVTEYLTKLVFIFIKNIFISNFYVNFINYQN